MRRHRLDTGAVADLHVTNEKLWVAGIGQLRTGTVFEHGASVALAAPTLTTAAVVVTTKDAATARLAAGMLKPMSTDPQPWHIPGSLADMVERLNRAFLALPFAERAALLDWSWKR